MSGITRQNFHLGVVQAVLFTDPDGFSLSGILKSFFPAVPLFDGEPQTISEDGIGLPPEVPRLVLPEKSGRWRCQIAPARMDLFWNRVDGGPKDDLRTVLNEAAKVIRMYRQKMSVTPRRVAAVVTRYAPHSDPGIFLAQHFCQPRWQEAPLNRPESFELHAHKSYDLKGFSVNSWFRAKSGLMTEREASTKVVLAEQDLNTVPRSQALSDDEISAFFAICPDELDHVLGLYFPEIQS